MHSSSPVICKTKSTAVSHPVWGFIRAGVEASSTTQWLKQQLRSRISSEQQRGRVVGTDISQNALVWGQVQLMPGQRGGLDQQTEQRGVLQVEEGKEWRMTERRGKMMVWQWTGSDLPVDSGAVPPSPEKPACTAGKLTWRVTPEYPLLVKRDMLRMLEGFVSGHSGHWPS